MSEADAPGRVDHAGEIRRDGYFVISKQPLQVLVFLLPLIIAYELSMVFILRSPEGPTQTNKAHKTLLEFFDLVGIQSSGWYFPGIAMLVVLVTWHVLARHAWRVNGWALVKMAIEAALLTLPLIVGAHLATMLDASAVTDAGSAQLAATLASGGGGVFAELSLPERLAMSIGAGLYEELVFRMLILGAIHALLVDLIGAQEWLGTTIAIVVSAGLFTLYHPIGDMTGSAFAIGTFLFGAGVYLGVLFIVRGFGIAVAAHALYDVFVAFQG